MSHGQQVWAKNGKALGPIVIPTNPSPAELFAAEELQKYLNRITGAQFEIRRGLANLPKRALVLAVLDRPSVASLLPEGLSQGIRYDGYRWQSKGDTLYIVANEPFGLVFGTYEFLRQKAGAVFLEYAPWGEEIPHLKILAHDPLDEVRNPRLLVRGMAAQWDWGPEQLLRRIDWLAKNGLNAIQKSTLEATRWEKERAWLEPELEKRGMWMETGCHTFQELLPAEAYRDEHPEYFALLEGKRSTEENRALTWCLSNPELREEVARNLIRFARENPTIRILGVQPNDGSAPLCECDDCRAYVQDAVAEEGWEERTQGLRKGARGSHPYKTHGYLRFANEMAQRLVEAFPQRRISILAYTDLTNPPKGLKPHPAVNVCLALYHRCAKHTLNDPDCPVNRRFNQALQEWLDATDEQWVYFYEYYMGMSAWLSLPYPTLTSMFAEWDDFISRGVKGAHVQSATGHLGVYGINYLAFARLAWDNPPTLDEYLKEYSSSLYAEAAEPVEAIFRLWEEAMNNEEHVNPNALEFAHKLFTPEVLKRWDELLAEARSLATNERVHWRLERMAAIRRYVPLVTAGTPLFYRMTRRLWDPSFQDQDKDLTPEEIASAWQMLDRLIAFGNEQHRFSPDLLGLFDDNIAIIWESYLERYQEAYGGA